MPRDSASVEPSDWRRLLAEATTDPRRLVGTLGLPESLADEAVAAAESMAMRVPRPFLDRIRPGDGGDPLLRQILPTPAECVPVDGFGHDPLGETQLAGHGGVLHKYRGRLLILTADRCGVHCRFCFRRHFPDRPEVPHRERLRELRDRLAADPSIREAILSGGDPFMLEDDALGEYLAMLDAAEHVARTRIHTRLPIAVPQRITPGLIERLAATRNAVYIVLHVNHANEIDDAVRTGLGLLRSSGAVLLAQTVLLRGVNDDEDTLADLCETLVDEGVLPYYLHRLDRVAGAAHFDVPVEEGRRLVDSLRARLPGYAVPRFVQETVDAPSKEVLG